MNFINKDDYKLIAVDGFHFSGSGLLVDILNNEGCYLPRNIRLDEFTDNEDNFSWPKATTFGYTKRERINVTLKLVKNIFKRIPLNIIQKTPIYRYYLHKKGRSLQMHESASVNRSIWSYLISIHMLILKNNFNETSFKKWFHLKYYWPFLFNRNIILDNGIPREKNLANWFFGLGGAIGIYVYREPRIQYQQILQVYNSRGMKPISYITFLNNLEAQYNSINWMLDQKYNVLFISFDKFLEKTKYYEKLKRYFCLQNICKDFNYDFVASFDNNITLTKLSRQMQIYGTAQSKELLLKGFQNKFEKHLNKIINLD
tara:strand:+ start:15067 stop:16011 length:945 start_codon:yes stop_codon:yes gene_type:complete